MSKTTTPLLLFLLTTLMPAASSALAPARPLPLAAEAAPDARVLEVTGLETRVWGINFADRDGVGESSPATLGSHWGISLHCYDLASDRTYAANNPVKYIDPTGLDVYVKDQGWTDHWDIAFDLACMPPNTSLEEIPVLVVYYRCNGYDDGDSLTGLACMIPGAPGEHRETPMSLASFMSMAGKFTRYTANPESTLRGLEHAQESCKKDYSALHTCQDVVKDGLRGARPRPGPGYNWRR